MKTENTLMKQSLDLWFVEWNYLLEKVASEKKKTKNKKKKFKKNATKNQTKTNENNIEMMRKKFTTSIYMCLHRLKVKRNVKKPTIVLNRNFSANKKSCHKNKKKSFF